MGGWVVCDICEPLLQWKRQHHGHLHDRTWLPAAESRSLLGGRHYKHHVIVLGYMANFFPHHSDALNVPLEKIKPPKGTDPSIQLECRAGTETGADCWQLHKEPLWPPGWAAASEAPPCLLAAATGSFCFSPKNAAQRALVPLREGVRHLTTAERNTSQRTESDSQSTCNKAGKEYFIWPFSLEVSHHWQITISKENKPQQVQSRVEHSCRVLGLIPNTKTRKQKPHSKNKTASRHLLRAKTSQPPSPLTARPKFLNPTQFPARAALQSAKGVQALLSLS